MGVMLPFEQILDVISCLILRDMFLSRCERRRSGRDASSTNVLCVPVPSPSADHGTFSSKCVNACIMLLYGRKTR